jgi:hypothetical protein
VKTFTYGPIGNPLSKSDVGTYTYPLGGRGAAPRGVGINGPIIRWMRATLDGVLEQSGAVCEAKFMLPWSFSESGRPDRRAV